MSVSTRPAAEARGRRAAGAASASAGTSPAALERDPWSTQTPDTALRGESWFGADTQWLSLAADDAADASIEPPGWMGSADGAADSRFLARQAQRIVGTGRSAFERVYRAFASARATLGLTLAITIAVSGFFGVLPDPAVVFICLAYAALAISMWLLPRFQRPAAPQTMARLRSPMWLATIGVDLLCFMALHALAPLAGLNFSALLVLPVLMAGVLTPRLMALATTAAIALALLLVAWINVIAGGDAAVLMTQAGLVGSGLFVIVVLASELAVRLAREELTARGSLEIARQQAQLNRLVIEQMQDGVLVVDRRGRVQAANPAARALLAPEGLAGPAPFGVRDEPAWRGLADAVDRAFFEAAWPEAGRDAVLDFEPGLSRTLRVRVRFTRRLGAGGKQDLCVVFLEDVRSVQARTRQEKLAAMGRVSAGIAHEIRNPLAAIAQANALLAEDAQGVEQRQLTQMVADNVGRLKRIVDDVMEVAPGGAAPGRVIDAATEVAAVCAEWTRTTGPEVPGLLQIELPGEPLPAAFDPDHLRRVLVNLLDNARRHGSGKPGAVLVRLVARDDGEALLAVASDGDPIAPEVERHLFEPFFSTRSRGSGLGLYISRELCERHGARINFRPRPASERRRNEFSVVMRRQVENRAPDRMTPP